MPSASYSFIDVAVIDGVRERFAVGDALAILSADLDEVIWANGPGAELFGYPDIEAIMGASARIGAVARRQIMATSGFPHIGTNRGIMVRLATGMTSRAVALLASALTLPDGASAILLALPATQAGSRSATEIAEKAISGFNEAGHFTALVDGQGGMAAAAAGLDALGISGETLRSLVAEVAGQKDRVVKRMIRGQSRAYPAGIARLTDDPALHFLVVIDESQSAQSEAPDEEAVAPAEASAEVAAGVLVAEEALPALADATADDLSHLKTMDEQPEEETGHAAPERPSDEPPVGYDPAKVPTEDVAATSEPVEPADAEADITTSETAADSPAQLDGWYFSAAGEPADPAISEPGAADEAMDVAREGEPLAEAGPETDEIGGVVDPEEAETVQSPIDRTAAPVRFVWRTDAESRFSAISQEFEAAVGKPAADVVGRRFGDVAAALGLDPSGEIAGLLDRRDTWSGRSVLWPVAGTNLRIPVDLAALPVYGRDRSFEGFRGFGVARGAEAIVDPGAAGLALTRSAERAAEPVGQDGDNAASAETPEPGDPFRGETPALTIVPKPERRFADKVIRLAEHRPHANDKGLSPVERNAFREIGERLKPALETDRPTVDTVEEAPAEAGATPASGEAADAVTGQDPVPTADLVPEVAPDDRDQPVAAEAAAEAASDGAANGVREAEVGAPTTAADDPADEPLAVAEATEPEQLSLLTTDDAGNGTAVEAGAAPAPAAPLRSRPNISLLGYVEPEADAADHVSSGDADPAETTKQQATTTLSGVPTEASEPAGQDATEAEAASDAAAGAELGAEARDPSKADAVETIPPRSDAMVVQTDDGEPDSDEAEDLAARAEYLAISAAQEIDNLAGAGRQPEPEQAVEDVKSDTVMSGGDAAEPHRSVDEIEHSEVAVSPDDEPRTPEPSVEEVAPAEDGTTEIEAGEPVEASADAAIERLRDQPVSPAPPIRNEGFLPSAFAMGIERRRRVPPDTSILEKLPVPVLIHSGDELHYANPEFLGLTGYGSIDALSDAGGLGALFADPDSEAHADSADRELWLRTNGGTEFPIEALLRSVPWAGGKALMLVVRRAGDERLVGDAGAMSSPTIAGLAARVAEMRTIIDTATDGVVLIAPDGTIRSISRPAEALFGFDSDEVAGKDFASLFAIESQRAASDYLSGLSDHGVASVLNDGREVIGRESQGRFIPLFMTIGRLPNDSGFCAVVRDITQWKRAEEDLTQARAIAERSSSQKSEFLARVSHEIRTPLNAIIGFSELMVGEKFGPIANDRYRDYLRDINRSGNHVLDIVNDLLDISKIEAGQQEMDYQAVSLNDTLGETVAMMQPQANRERVIIRSSFASKLPDVVADPRSIRQIALNILSNAIRYTQAGGQVIVSTSYEASGDIVMRVRDTGIGMTQAEIEQALKPFKQINSLKRARGDGTGLGLPLTKAMVEANRAKFAINSTPGDGTLVEVVFPSTRVLAD